MTSRHEDKGPGSLGRRGLAAFAVLVLAALLCASPATAASYTFTDTTTFLDHSTDEPGDLVSSGGAFVNKLEYRHDWVTWEHQFEFNPPAAEVLSGTLVLSLRDDRDWCYQYEWGLLRGEDGLWAWGEVDTDDYAFNVNADALVDGDYRVKLKSLSGDFYIDQSDLTVTYNAVPLPGAGLLFASGLAGVAGIGRRRLRPGMRG